MNSFQKLAYEIQRGQMLRKVAEEGLSPAAIAALTSVLTLAGRPNLSVLAAGAVDASTSPEGRRGSRFGHAAGYGFGGQLLGGIGAGMLGRTGPKALGLASLLGGTAGTYYGARKSREND